MLSIHTSKQIEKKKKNYLKILQSLPTLFLKGKFIQRKNC